MSKFSPFLTRPHLFPSFIRRGEEEVEVINVSFHTPPPPPLTKGRSIFFFVGEPCACPLHFKKSSPLNAPQRPQPRHDLSNTCIMHNLYHFGHILIRLWHLLLHGLSSCCPYKDAPVLKLPVYCPALCRLYCKQSLTSPCLRHGRCRRMSHPLPSAFLLIYKMPFPYHPVLSQAGLSFCMPLAPQGDLAGMPLLRPCDEQRGVIFTLNNMIFYLDYIMCYII